MCAEYMTAICICDGKLVYDEYSQQCIDPSECPPLSVLENAQEKAEPYDHCDESEPHCEPSADAHAHASSDANASA